MPCERRSTRCAPTFQPVGTERPISKRTSSSPRGCDVPLPANVRLLIDLAAVLKERRLRWYVFGAQAASYYGRPRMTEDVDVTVRVPRGKLRALIEALAKAKLEPRVAELEALGRGVGIEMTSRDA